MISSQPSDIVISASGLSKVYQLYESPFERLKESFHPLRKKYHREFHALDGVSFQVRKGETVGIIGRNGSGKSTLLKMLTGVLTPSAGNLEVRGRVLALLELGAGFNPELTGIENIYFNGTLLGASRQEMNTKLESILSFADIGEFVNQPVKTYSSGMYVRLAFAVIANMDADVLIVDEALSVGDAFFVQKCMRYLRSFIESGTLIFVSHDTGAITSLCDRAIWIDKGLMLKDSTPKDVTEAYLANLYETQQGESSTTLVKENKPQTVYSEPRDMRLDFINASSLRNDIQLFQFEESGNSFGKGGAEVRNVLILDCNDCPLSWCVGGENVNLVICCVARESLNNVVIGFVVKDRLGQIVFADNTFLTYVDKPQAVNSGQNIEARFSFRMPVMPNGDYSISVAIADGTQEEHIQHRWINDALMFKIQTSSICHGLVGVPMSQIRIRVE